MSILGIKIKENPFYAPYDDECWMVLAQVMMTDFAQSYTYLTPTTALSQEEYLKLDDKSYAPVRRSILRKIQNGPLGNVVSIDAVRDALEIRRQAYKKALGIHWIESENLK